jgi:hypothetical protein
VHIIQENGRNGNTCDKITERVAIRCNKAAQTAASSLELRRITSLTSSMQIVNRNGKAADVTQKILKEAVCTFQIPRISNYAQK